MNKYRFRLETVRKLRALERDQQRTALAEAFQAEQILADHRAELANERAELRNLERGALADEYLDVNRMVEAQRYETVLKANETNLAIQSHQLAIEVERRRLAVVEADRSVRVLELLDERQRREHDRQQQRLDVKQLDEIAMLRQPQRFLTSNQ
jgi:flagellar export protein FliJ